MLKKYPEMEIFEQEQPLASKHQTLDIQAQFQQEDPVQKKAKLAFTSIENVKNYIKNVFENDGPARGQNPFLYISDAFMKELVKEAFFAKPWSNTENLSLDIDGIGYPISYKIFHRAGRLQDLHKWHSDAIDAYLSNFEKVVELLSHKARSQRYNGWQRAKKWWPEIIEKSLRKKPFTSLHKLKLVHNGKKITNPYDYVRKYGNEADRQYIRNKYDEIFKEYINESFDHAVQYIFSGKQFLWEKVPEKWRKEFFKRCFEENPFGGADNGLKLTHNGITVRAPVGYYRSIGKQDRLKYIIKEVLAEYLSSLQRVVEFINHPNFQRLGGWRAIQGKFKRVIIINAILQSKDTKPAIKNLMYVTKEKNSAAIKNLYGFYRKTKQKDVFQKYYGEGIEFKNHFSAESKKSIESGAVHDQTASKQTDPIQRTAEEIKQKIKRGEIFNPIKYDELKNLILDAKNGGGAEARFLIAQMFRETIRKVAGKFAKGNQTVLEDLIQDGIEKAAECIEHFNFDKSQNFEGYLYKVLLNKFITRSMVYNCGYSEKQIGYIGMETRKLRRLSADKSASYLEMTPEEIAKITKYKIKTVVGLQETINKKRINLETPVKGYDNKTIADFIPDNECDKPEDIVEKQKIAEIISTAILTMNLKEQIILKQTFGIKGICGTSPYQLKDAFKNSPSIPEIAEAVKEFHKKLKEFCLKPEFESQEAIEKLKAITEASKNPGDTMNGKNALGMLLASNIDFRVENIFIHILLSLDAKKAIILSEIFNIPYHRERIGEELARFFGDSRANINNILHNKIYPRIKAALKSKNQTAATGAA